MEQDKIIIKKIIGKVVIPINKINNVTYGVEKDIILHYNGRKYDLIGISKDIQNQIINQYHLNELYKNHNHYIRK